MFKLYSSMPVYKYDPEESRVVVTHYEVVYECSWCGTKQAVKFLLKAAEYQAGFAALLVGLHLCQKEGLSLNP